MTVHCFFAYNPNLINKPPVLPIASVQRRMWNRINGGFISVRRTPVGLMGLIQMGYPYTAAHHSYRHERNFTVGQTLSLDFDTGDDFSRISNLVHDPFIAANATFLYTTPSHTEEEPRSRAVFVLDEPVYDPEVYSLAARSLVRLYQQSDQTCKDPARIFFGSRDCQASWVGNRMPIEVLGELMMQVREEDRQKAEEARNFTPTPVSDRTVRETLEQGLSLVRNAPDGERHNTRLRISTLFGGYVGGGYVPFEVAREHLLDAALMNTDSPMREVERDINSGLTRGIGQPVEIRPRYLADFGFSLPE